MTKTELSELIAALSGEELITELRRRGLKLYEEIFVGVVNGLTTQLSWKEASWKIFGGHKLPLFIACDGRPGSEIPSAMKGVSHIVVLNDISLEHGSSGGQKPDRQRLVTVSSSDLS